MDIDLHSGFTDLLGLVLREATPDLCVGAIDAGESHHQPLGLVHGGVYASLVETLASTGAALWAIEQGMAGVVGVSNSTDFLRAHRRGPLTGTATPIHRGRTQQLWLVEVTRDSDGKLVARGQVRLQNLAELPA